MIRRARARVSIGCRVLLPSPSPPGWGVATVVSRGGFDRRLTFRLKFREVRVLADVSDERVGEESGEVFDELSWERRRVGEWGARVRGLILTGWGRAAGLIERVCRRQVSLHVVGRQ